jgi:phosphatidate cytidylyltransferase
VAAAIAGLLVLVPAGVALIRLRLEDNGAWLVLFSLVVVMAADVGAYFAGHRFGRTKLAPQVSPGKSWEGVIGGVVASLIVAAIGAVLLDWPALPVMLLAAGAAAFSVVGDLTESLMKRHTGLKDSGRLFPGHGGVLDRFDSLSAGIPVFVLGLIKVGALA